MATNNTKKKTAGDIIFSKEFPRKCQNLKKFMNILLEDVKVESKQVGKKFVYCSTLSLRQDFAHHGLIMDYFIRKVLAQKYKLNLNDNYAETVLKNVGLYFTPLVKGIILPKILEQQYQIYTDTKTQAMDIIHAIKVVSLSKILFRTEFGPPQILTETNHENLLEVIKYFESLDYANAEVKCNIDCKYFEAKADIIFDGKVLYEIKTSKNTFVNCYKDNDRYRKNFQKLLLYSFGYYKKTGIIIKKFVIYNPLLGEELTIDLKAIDMVRFDAYLDKDIKKLTI